MGEFGLIFVFAVFSFGRTEDTSIIAIRVFRIFVGQRLFFTILRLRRIND
jgi:hypothetical protein